jgi:formylglycine-generating enzyme required for sulfatase activity/tRNA A-37 threonylcarbamoyl transferase component Bud32
MDDDASDELELGAADGREVAQEPRAHWMAVDPSSGAAPEALAERLAALRSRRPSGGRHIRRRELGRGGMGVVYEAWDIDLQRVVALKVLRESAAPPAQRRLMLDRFLEEAQVTGQLQHPGIVPIHELGIDETGALYYTMPLIKGRTLLDILASLRADDAQWTLARVVAVLQRTAEAIGFAHSKGVVHRDLKPANIMVGRFGETYVLDWGLAKVLGPRTMAGAPNGDESVVETTRRLRAASSPDSSLVTIAGDVLGTPSYMPPEQATGNLDQLAPPADVYALGAILYTALAGHPPYQEPGSSRGAEHVLERLVAAPPRPLAEAAPAAPAELVAIAEKAMARSSRDRYRDLAEVGEELRAFLEVRVVRAHASGPWAELRKWVARNRAVAVSSTALVMVMVGGTSGIAWLSARESENLAAKNLELGHERDVAQANADKAAVRDLEEDLARHGLDAPGMDRARRWLRTFAGLDARRGRYREALADPAASTLARDPRVTSELLVELVARIDELQPECARVDRLVLDHERAQSALLADSAGWRVAGDAVARDPRFIGFTLAPRLGLAPLGADPHSGLQEFWCVASGARPRRHPETGSVTPRVGDALVLVLVPGGQVALGSPLGEPQQGHDEFERVVDLAPFFIAKYEVTQDQWLRVMDRLGVKYPEGFGIPVQPTVTSLHPVETVNLSEAISFARRIGLSLPSEDEWEHACRAGTRTMFCWGGPGDLDGRENLADKRFSLRAKDLSDDFILFENDDGYVTHAPVGSYAANPFGLHDMHGNVSEWTRSEYVEDRRPGAVSEVGGDAGRTVIRGGNYMFGWHFARAATRLPWVATTSNETIGFRPALAASE